MIINKKKIFEIIIFVFFGIVISFFAFYPIEKKYETSDWMKDLSDSTIINEMSIPGTHNSAANHSMFDVSGKCQDMTILNQLKIGVRFLDIRLKLANNKFVLVHDFVNQNLYFKDVLDDINSFIEINKSEFLIISLKEDADPKNSDLVFEEELYQLLSKYNNIVFDNNLPKTLGEARGKIYILNRYSANNIGIQAREGWKDSTSFELGSLYVQDNYCIDNIETKKEDIINAFEYLKNNDKLLINFVSCYVDGKFPPMYAPLPASEINPWLLEYINDYDEKLGIVLFDFITEEISKEIYMRNNYEVSN